MNRSNAERQLDLNLKKAAGAKMPVSPLVRTSLDAAYASLPDRPDADPASVQTSKRRGRRRSSALRRTVVVAASVVAISAGLFASGFVSPVMADTIREIPVIGSLFSRIEGDAGLRTAGERSQGTFVEATGTSGSMKVKVKETIFDGTRVAFAADLTVPGIDSTYKLEERMQNVSLSIDGRPDMNGFFYDEPQDRGNGTYSLLMNMPLDPAEARGLDERFDGKITITMQGNVEPLVVTVPFERIETDREVHLNPGPTVSDDRYTLSIDTLDVTASTVQLGTTLELKNKNASAAEQDEALLDSSYEIVDDRGKVLDVVGGQAMQDGGAITGISNYGADLSESDYIVVKPYLGDDPSKVYLEDLEIKIDLNAGQ
ncbi:DUF4179 domain-containing protein [Saccharibacillus sp. CPCC 101409]|uniref:DUF4179 domain-containing protein n=1 Tax=Saccharibacillus sp. CPCC 101409 TaxID=3058041 RepID=UPI002672057A|nr:DUF4179 domain-containing protein [Saccharibacillus sp. CPCC 101409]MDO3413251.1 DUF4179 domain-containing protein [Saccharibacillus sp. CPCC 101409]